MNEWLIIALLVIGLPLLVAGVILLILGFLLSSSSYELTDNGFIEPPPQYEDDEGDKDVKNNGSTIPMHNLFLFPIKIVTQASTTILQSGERNDAVPVANKSDIIYVRDPSHNDRIIHIVAVKDYFSLAPKPAHLDIGRVRGAYIGSHTQDILRPAASGNVLSVGHTLLHNHTLAKLSFNRGTVLINPLTTVRWRGPDARGIVSGTLLVDDDGMFAPFEFAEPYGDIVIGNILQRPIPQEIDSPQNIHPTHHGRLF